MEAGPFSRKKHHDFQALHGILRAIGVNHTPIKVTFQAETAPFADETDAAMATAARSACRTISGTAVISQSVPWQSGPMA
jgi:hypothetical protein